MPIWHGPYRVDSLHSVPGVPKRIVVFNTFNAIAIQKLFSVISFRAIQMQIPEIAENIPAIKAIRASGPGATGHGTDEQSFFRLFHF